MLIFLLTGGKRRKALLHTVQKKLKEIKKKKKKDQTPCWCVTMENIGSISEGAVIEVVRSTYFHL